MTEATIFTAFYSLGYLRERMTKPYPKLWFRAFNRNSPADIIKVLFEGDTPHPDPQTTTRVNEGKLGITPGHVYAYLSRLEPSFGSVGVALNYEQCAEGKVTPFDTGSLIKHASPIEPWSDEKKREVLATYSWERLHLDKKLRQWPGKEWDSYTRGTRPTDVGPHVPLKTKLELPIWGDAKNQWRCWVWELRVPERLEFAKRIVWWTCDPLEHQAIRTAATAAAIKSKTPPKELEWLSKAYIGGGISRIFEKIRRLK